MGTITATAQPDKGRVRLDIDWTSNPSPRCQVFRIVAGGTPTLIREGAPCVLSNNKATIYDTEGALDQPTVYRTTVQLNDNADMEFSVEEWQTTNTTGGTAAQSTGYYFAGSASLQFTPTGAAAAPQLLSDQFAVTVGTSYTATAQLLAAARWAGGTGIIINWYTSGLVYLSTSGTASNLWPAVGKWEQYTVTGTAPATAAFARIGFLWAGTPAVANVFYVDEAYATTPLGTVDSAVVLLPSTQGGWWSDPLHPGLMLRVIDREDMANQVARDAAFRGVVLGGVSRPSKPADSAIMEVPGQALGVNVFAHRKSSRRNIQLVTGNFDDSTALRTLHDQGGPLHLRIPGAYGVADAYWACGQLDSTSVGQDMKIPLEVHGTSMTHVAPPPGPNDGVAGARYADLRKGGLKTTFATANAASLTWQDGLKGNIS